MNPYLKQLKKNTHISEVSPTKPTEPSFEGFVGSTLGDTVNIFSETAPHAHSPAPDFVPALGGFEGFVGGTLGDSANFFIDSCVAGDDGDETEAMLIARRAIAVAALTDGQRLSRLADLQRDPTIANFWLAFADVTPLRDRTGTDE